MPNSTQVVNKYFKAGDKQAAADLLHDAALHFRKTAQNIVLFTG
jgi:hypothetical protein